MSTPGDPISCDVAALYRSPTNKPFAVSENILAPPSDNVADTTQFLEALSQAVKQTQARINKELTSRMQEDKAREAAAGGASASLAVDEDKEDEHYCEGAIDYY